MRIIAGPHRQARVAVRPLHQGLAAGEQAGDGGAAVEGLARIGDHAGVHQVGNALGDQPGMDAKILVAM